MSEETSAKSASASGRLPSLDGWRAISIVLVLGAHSPEAVGFPDGLREAFRWIFDGALGVRFFFCISGFLITYLMLREAERSGTVSLRDFYLRRALRILPVYLLYLGVLAGLQQTTPFALTPGQWASSLTFTVNFGGGQWLNGHLWSLAVEEQFYLLWPVLFVAGGLAARGRRALLLLLVPIVAAPVLRVACYMKWLPPQLSWLEALAQALLFHLDVLAIGCAAAFLFSQHHAATKAALCSRPGLVRGAAFALILVPHLLVKSFMMGIFTVPFAVTCQTLGFVLLMLQSICQPEWGGYRLLNSAAARHIGVLSYSLYIWQQLFCASPATFGWSAPWWMSFPGWLLAAFVAAGLSYYLFEVPFLSLRARFRHAPLARG